MLGRRWLLRAAGQAAVCPKMPWSRGCGRGSLVPPARRRQEQGGFSWRDPRSGAAAEGPGSCGISCLMLGGSLAVETPHPPHPPQGRHAASFEPGEETCSRKRFGANHGLWCLKSRPHAERGSKGKGSFVPLVWSSKTSQKQVQKCSQTQCLYRYGGDGLAVGLDDLRGFSNLNGSVSLYGGGPCTCEPMFPCPASCLCPGDLLPHRDLVPVNS